jgi:hypothetical protein
MGWVLKAIRRLCAVVLGSRRVKVNFRDIKGDGYKVGGR